MDETGSDMEAPDYHDDAVTSEANDTCETETTPVFRKARSDRRLDLIAQVHEKRGWAPPKR